MASLLLSYCIPDEIIRNGFWKSVATGRIKFLTTFKTALNNNLIWSWHEATHKISLAKPQYLFQIYKKMLIDKVG